MAIATGFCCIINTTALLHPTPVLCLYLLSHPISHKSHALLHSMLVAPIPSVAPHPTVCCTHPICCTSSCHVASCPICCTSSCCLLHPSHLLYLILPCCTSSHLLYLILPCCTLVAPHPAVCCTHPICCTSSCHVVPCPICCTSSHLLYLMIHPAVLHLTPSIVPHDLSCCVACLLHPSHLLYLIPPCSMLVASHPICCIIAHLLYFDLYLATPSYKTYSDLFIAIYQYSIQYIYQSQQQDFEHGRIYLAILMCTLLFISSALF